MKQGLKAGDFVFVVSGGRWFGLVAVVVVVDRTGVMLNDGSGVAVFGWDRVSPAIGGAFGSDGDVDIAWQVEAMRKQPVTVQMFET